MGAGGDPQLSAVQPGITLPDRDHLTAGEHSVQVLFITSNYDVQLFFTGSNPMERASYSCHQFWLMPENA
ncbi:MAG: hypothetical protein ACJ78Q_10455 [Chloroflexia bacterium]